MSRDREDSAEARLRRIETTLYLLCRHLGLDPRSGDRLTELAPHQPSHRSREDE